MFLPAVIDDELRGILADTLRTRAASVRLSLQPYAPLTLTGRPEGDPDVLQGWRLHAHVDGFAPDDNVPIRLRLEKFERAHVENGVAIFVRGEDRLEISAER
jgi:hypothetical protein